MDFVEIRNEDLDSSMGLHGISAESQDCALSDVTRETDAVGTVRLAAREQIGRAHV